MVQILPLAVLIAGALLIWVAVIANHVARSAERGRDIVGAWMWTLVATGVLLVLLDRAGAGDNAGRTVQAVGAGSLAALLVGAVVGARDPLAGPARRPVAILAAMSILDVAFLALNPATSDAWVRALLGLTLIPGLGYMVGAAPRPLEDRLRLVEGVSAAVVWLSIVLAAFAPELAYGTGFSDQRRISLPGIDARLSGVAPHPNFLGIVAALAIVLSSRHPWRRRLAQVLPATLVLVLTESRVALAALLLAAALAWILRGRTPALRATLAVPVTMLVALQLGAFVPSEATGALTADVSNNGRFRVWADVLDGVAASPLQGWGPLAFSEGSGSNLGSSGLLHAHNQYFQAIAEAGIVGLALVVALLLTLGRRAWRQRSNFVRPAAFVILGLGLFTEPLLSPHIYGINFAAVPPALILIVLLSQTNGSRDTAVVSGRGRLALRNSVAVAAVHRQGAGESHQEPETRS